MGVDAIALAAVADPPLTTIGFRATAIVDAAVDAMMGALSLPTDDIPPGGEFVVLIDRASPDTGRIRAHPSRPTPRDPLPVSGPGDEFVDAEAIDAAPSAEHTGIPTAFGSC